ncbi:aspartate aminotransferase family protein [Conexibacter sp. CPCC 206217]|uniref:aspartate aminotransferase family protein n=1 Tax=Conexibacter sp. CPCC 206217 TaxID=3064574 RepID=UPI00271EECCA|nr:aspartate aminotransferase family protein [Conexibacter sp. CPCC 206217]MDO8212663.1 aspartate aminotransferase family protein [Conexibacter sp. CPCC 206217]
MPARTGVVPTSELARVSEARYRAGRTRSQALSRQASGVFPQGVSGAAKHFDPFPIFVASAGGSHVADVDDNDYVDLLMGAGPMLLGHGHPAVVEAIREQVARMTNPMMPIERSMLLAERIRGHMPYLERLRFANTGSEATRSAVRVARAATGRRLIAKCEGNFHGSDDTFLVSTHSRRLAGSDARPEPVADYAGLAPDVLDGVILLPFNDVQAAVEIIHHHAADLAGVIMEPVAFSSGGAVPATREFAAAVRAATRRHAIALIFDEVLCAYRMGLAGAPAYLGVAPDLATIGKAVGGGMPLAAFGGSAEWMEAALGTEAGARKIFQSGTFTENPVSIEAGLAVLDVLENEPVLERADAIAELMREGLQRELDAHGEEAVVTGAGSIFQVHFGAREIRNRRDVLRSELERTRAFLLGLVAHGVLWPPIHPAVTSGAHDEDDVELLLEATRAVLSAAE